MEQEVNEKRSSENRYTWRQSFYKAYERKDFVTAEKIYLSREKYDKGIPDVHTAYKLEKKLDQAHIIVILGTCAFVLLCLFGITECKT